MGDSSGKEQMMEFIYLTDQLLAEYARVNQVHQPYLVEHVEETEVTDEPTEHPIMEDCRELVYKLRAFMESESGGEYALGVETGMQRAADMIENLIRRFEKGDGFE